MMASGWQVKFLLVFGPPGFQLVLLNYTVVFLFILYVVIPGVTDQVFKEPLEHGLQYHQSGPTDTRRTTELSI